MKRFIVIIITVALLLCGGIVTSAAGLDNIPYDSYTYWKEDNGKYLVGSRAMYEVADTLDGEDLNISPLSKPTDIVTDNDGKVYILDGDNSRIVVLSKELTLSQIITQIDGKSFKGASGLSVSADKTIYVADTENKRVLVRNADGSASHVIKCPDSDVIPDDFEFRPLQLTVDKNNYLYVLSKGSFYGALVFAPDGSTDGFFGANKVNASVSDVFETLWNRWFMTDDQRASQVQKIPYQFSDLCADDNGLLYTTTGALASSAQQTGQIRCLGPGGGNVMKNRVGRQTVSADSFNFADNKQANLAVGKRTQNFVSITVKDGFIYALDQTYGKIYVYNDCCELLTVFGGGVKKGIQTGVFENAVSIAVSGNKLYVLDSVKGNVTVFNLNDYGKKLKQAMKLTDNGKYIEAEPLWKQIISADRNNQSAYRGLARASLAHGNYNSAMQFAKQGMDRGIYDQAFENVRNEFLERNTGWLIPLAILIICGAIALLTVKKRRQVSVISKSYPALAISSFCHPFDNFRAVKYSARGSVAVAVVILVLYYITDVCKDFYTGFVHSDFNVEEYNSLLTLLGTVGIVLLWAICNWAVSVLAEGKSRLKEVFIVACYSLIPLEIGNIIYLISSNILLQKESVILTAVSTVCVILAAITLCVGTMIVHEFDFFKFLWTTILTLIAMAIVIFLIFMIVILLQQFFAFIRTVFIEVTYR